MGSSVLITGASTGFGRATAELLALRGYTVFATMRDTAGRNAANAAALQELARQEGLQIHVLPLDVTDDVSVTSAVEQALTIAGRLDVVINNAGFGSVGLAETYTVEEFQQLFNTNFFGVLRVNRAVLPSMRRQRSGLLIHVSSVAGRVTAPCVGAYCASKYALEAVADAYRFELAPFGIDSVLVEPGVYKTSIFDKLQSPGDAARIAEYGPVAESAQRVLQVFQQASLAPETPSGDELADVFLRLIETPMEQRPFRTLCGVMAESLLPGYNEMAEGLRPMLAEMFQVADLLAPPKALTAGTE